MNSFLRFLNSTHERLPQLAVLLLGLSLAAQSQQANRTLTGTVTGNSGSRIANALLSIRKTDGTESRVVTSNGTGVYTVTGLSAGSYEITVSAPGFAVSRKVVRLGAGSDQLLNFMLKVVSGVSSNIDENTNAANVRDLPLNGRSAADVAALEPGVTTARTQSSGEGQRGFGTQMTISGARPRQNDVRLDGISVNDYSNGSPGSALGVSLGVDAVEEVSVLSSNYPSQYGRSSGGIVSSSTHSGTNKFHGNVFEFLRNSTLDARNFFDRAKPPFRRNQFGASAGGPIWKDRTFIFGDYEGVRQSLGVTQVDTVPSPAAREGNLSSGPIAADPNVLRFLRAFYPLPNGPILGSGDTGIFTFAGQQIGPENYFTTRVDQKFRDNDLLSGTYMFDSATVRLPDELNNKRTGYDSRRQFVTVAETHTFNSQLVNSFRIGVNRVVTTTGLTFPSGNEFANDPSFGTVPEANAAAILVTGLTSFSGGLGARSNYHFHWTSIQVYDDVSLTRGRHSMRVGVSIERLRDNILAVSNPAGEFSFNSLSDFLTNKPFSLSAAIPNAITGRGFRQVIFGSYFEDAWRWHPNLTLNLGLRYEMATVPGEVDNKLTVLRNLTDAQPLVGQSLFSNPTLRNFEPRIGFLWDPQGGGKTAIGAGFGMFDVLPLPYLIQFNELFSAPFYKGANATNLPSGAFPSTAFSILAASPSNLRAGYNEPNPRRNYVMQWNVTAQHALGKNASTLVAYVGSRGVHNPFRVEDADIVLPTLTPFGYLWPSPAGSGTRLNSNWGRIPALFWRSDSYYHALEVQLKKRLGGASLQASYTWGKSIDTSSGSLVGDEYTNSISSPLWFDPKLNRGLSDFNVAQNLQINYTWKLGEPTFAQGLSGWALSGWQLGGVFEGSTGVPFTPTFGGDALGLRSTDPSIDVPNLINSPACRSLVNVGNPAHYIRTQCFVVPDPITLRGNLGRNTLIGPGLLNFDFSVFKNNRVAKISDNFNVQFRAEFFNILNRANFSPPLDNREIFDASGQPVANAGLITSTQTPARQIQLALKLIW